MAEINNPSPNHMMPNPNCSTNFVPQDLLLYTIDSQSSSELVSKINYCSKMLQQQMINTQNKPATGQGNPIEQENLFCKCFQLKYI